MEGKCRVYAGASGNVLCEDGGRESGGAGGVVWESIDNLSKSQGGAQSGWNVPLLAALFIKGFERHGRGLPFA